MEKVVRAMSRQRERTGKRRRIAGLDPLSANPNAKDSHLERRFLHDIPP
jgi:hypothetical protein